jgi:uncharacterized protein (TIGR00255 family)
MTAYASRRSDTGGRGWLMELRGVNGRGLDLRLRLPEGAEPHETALRARIGGRVTRGSLTLTVRPEGAGAEEAGRIAANLALIAQVQALAGQAGIILAPPTAAEVIGLRATQGQQNPTDFNFLLVELDALLEDFDAVRAAEGAALTARIAGHLDQIDDLVAAGRRALAEQSAETAPQLVAALARIRTHLPDADPQRLAQEAALLATRADATEELDRLTAHLAAARGLLTEGAAVGRKLDFLTQEFMREANTLCAKATAMTLTRVGLDLKSVIDQMREQVQNIE